MARKHAKKFSKKQPVETITIAPSVRTVKVITNPETGDFVTKVHNTPPVRKQGKAQGPTTTKGQKNTAPSKTGAKK